MKADAFEMGYTPKTDLYSLFNSIHNGMKRGSKKGLGTRPGQNRVLKTLESAEDGTLTSQELRSHLGIRSSSLYDLLGKLEKDGYVTRERTNRGGNETKVSITPLGRVCALESRITEHSRDQELFASLSPEDRDELIRILNGLLESWYVSDEDEGARREQRWREKSAERDEAIDIMQRLQALEAELSEQRS